jgi:hypothetical protein
MGKSVTKVIFKPDPNASDVFLVIVNTTEVRFVAKATEQFAHIVHSYRSSMRNGRAEVIILSSDLD